MVATKVVRGGFFMSKKPKAERPKLQRKRAVSVQEIRGASERTARLSAALSAIAHRADAGGLKELVFDGANAHDRGIDLLKVFISGATRALEFEDV